MSREPDTEPTSAPVPEERPRRLFVSIDTPTEPLLPVLTALAERGLRTVAPDRVHLTLAFMAAVPEPLVGSLAEALAALAETWTPFTLRYSGEVGRFGRAVVWAGLDECAELHELAGAVRGAVAEAGVPVEDRPFRAHVTLARGGRRGVRGGDLQAHRIRRTAWPVERARLIESRLGGGPARWRQVRELPFAQMRD